MKRFMGSWNCSRIDGSIGRMTFTNIADGMRVRVDWKRGAMGFGFDHIFTVDESGNWTTTQTDADGNTTFEGISQGFAGDVIAFTGVSQSGDRSYPAREVFRFTSDGLLQHIWYGQNSDNQWQPTGYQECTKV